MIDTEKEKRIWRRSKLRAGIVKCLSKRWRYLDQTRDYFLWTTNEEFDGVVAEMVEEGVLTKMYGRDGGAKLSLGAVTPHEEAANG